MRTGNSEKSCFDHIAENKISVSHTKEMTLSMHRKMDRILFPFSGTHPIAKLYEKFSRKMLACVPYKSRYHRVILIDNTDIDYIFIFKKVIFNFR